MFFSGCASVEPDILPSGQNSFEEYQTDTINWIKEHRDFQTQNREEEIFWNAPGEWRPKKNAPAKGILLVHGLGSSPYDFIDIAPMLADNGFLVRTVLLAGCGTKPSDMLEVSVDDWRQVVEQQINIMSREVSDIYLGGFSAGANLVIEYSSKHPEIKGLVLFSPAVKSNTPFAFITPAASKFNKWLFDPEKYPSQLPARYILVPTNAFAQFYYSSSSVRSLLKKSPYTKPVLIVQTRHDSVIDSKYILELFESKFTHPESRLIWYGEVPEKVKISSRVIVRPDYLPEWQISQFSHTGILFSPENKEYGYKGKERICWNGQTKEDYEKCLLGEDVWYSDWGYKEEGKIHARLTFNPYFNWQSGIMLDILNKE